MNRIITILRKPLETTVARTVLEHGTGGLNIEGTRIESDSPVVINTWDDGAKPFGGGAGHSFTSREETGGRWPANVVLTGRAEEALGGERAGFFKVVPNDE